MTSPLETARAALARELARRRILSAAPGARIARSAEIRSPERLRLGAGTVVDSNVLLHCGGMEWSQGGGGIELGSRVYIGPNSVLFGAGGITIGDAAQISPGVVITSHQHTFAQADLDIRDQPIEFAPVVLERDTWIGANATVVPGVRIGASSVVGAGAVVVDDVPARSLVVGVPARVVRER